MEVVKWVAVAAAVAVRAAAESVVVARVEMMAAVGVELAHRLVQEVAVMGVGVAEVAASVVATREVVAKAVAG